MFGIIITLILLLLTMWRITFINGLLSDWNNQLDIYINKLEIKFGSDYRDIKYFKRFRLKPYRYWFRLDCWEIKDVISDPFLIDDIQSQIQSKYIN